MYRWKGKFVKESVYKTMLQRSNNCKKRRITPAKDSNHDSNIFVDDSIKDSTSEMPGNRIVNLKYFAKQMYCKSCEEPLLIQNIVEDTVQGLGSIIKIKCAQCLLQNEVVSSEMYKNPATGRSVFAINTKAALGTIHTGIGQTEVEKFLNIIDVPGINSKLYKNHERIIGPIIEQVAKESCAEAAAMERTLTLESLQELKKILPSQLQDGFLVIENLSPNSPPIVRVFVSYDMGWSMRGNGHTYDSLNGYCAIIGLKTGKVLDFCTRNRKCKQCDVLLRTGIKKEHDCRKNFDGSAKAMEADGAVQLVLHSEILKEANIEVGVLAGDNDSSSIAAIEEKASHEIVKQNDTNHSARGVATMLYKMRDDRTKDPDKELSNDTIAHIKRCFSYVIHKNKDSVQNIESGLVNIPYHLFDYHENCGSWCSGSEEKENSVGIRLQNQILFTTLKEMFHQLSENATKFVGAPSSQANESLNNTMCTKSRKSVCYSTSESADFRFAASVAQKNYGDTYLKHSMAKALISWDEQLETHINKSEKLVQKRREKRSQPDYKIARLNRQAKRSQLKYQKESSEGATYESHMTLIDHKKAKIEDCIKIVDYKYPNYKSDDFAIAFFDLETGGLSYKHEILQIFVKCGTKAFSSYITPTKSIDAGATNTTGLTKVHKKLYLYGNEVATLPRLLVFKELLKFLQSFGKKIIMVAHNCSFDSSRLIISIKQLSLVTEFSNIIHGFSDTLQLFKNNFPKIQFKLTNYKLTTLAKELLSLSVEGAHDAGVDVKLLEQLTASLISVYDVVKSSESIEDIIERMKKEEDAKEIVSSYKPMSIIISKNMQKRLAATGITYQHLISTFQTKGTLETKKLLLGEVDGKPQIIKSKKILNAILDYLNSVL